MTRINLNDLARTITLREGRKQEVSIAQVKEVLRITLEELGDRLMVDPASVVGLLQRYAGKE